MSRKQFPYDSNSDLVLPALKALTRTNNNIQLIDSQRVVYRPSASRKVTLLSGGGSGHEPTHAGFVGSGMLDVAVCGSIFASPSTKQVLSGLQAVSDTSKGTLVIVKNYTGDVLNFGLAAEIFNNSAEKGDDNSLTRVVVVGDDVAVGKKKGGLVGRRGLAGTILVHKIAGALAEKSGDDDAIALDVVGDMAQAVIDNTVTIGCSLDHCNVPGRKFEVPEYDDTNEMEIGMGIHNEPGVKKLSPIPKIPELIEKELLPLLLDPKDSDRAFWGQELPKESDDVVLLVNNLGGLSNLEMLSITQTALEILEAQYKIIPKRVAVGSFITALNGPGFSLTLLHATRADAQFSKTNSYKCSVIDLFDAPATAPGWSVVPYNRHSLVNKSSSDSKPEKPIIPVICSKSGITETDPKRFSKILESGMAVVEKAEPQITKYDTVAGDGDCGETLVSGVTALRKALEKPVLQAPTRDDKIVSGNEGAIRMYDSVDAILDIAEIVQDSMGGTSGGLYALFLTSLAKSLNHTNSVSEKPEKSLSVDLFAKALPRALESLGGYTNARVGDRTLMDALIPFVETLEKTKDLEKAVEAVQKGAESTRKLEAKFGRASYVAQEELDQFQKEGGLPDPGAIGLASLLKGFLDGYKN